MEILNPSNYDSIPAELLTPLFDVWCVTLARLWTFNQRLINPHIIDIDIFVGVGWVCIRLRVCFCTGFVTFVSVFSLLVLILFFSTYYSELLVNSNLESSAYLVVVVMFKTISKPNEFIIRSEDFSCTCVQFKHILSGNFDNIERPLTVGCLYAGLDVSTGPPASGR